MMTIAMWNRKRRTLLLSTMKTSTMKGYVQTIATLLVYSATVLLFFYLLPGCLP